MSQPERREEIVVRGAPDSMEALTALLATNPDGTVPHVRCEGARFHVLSWGKERRCSEPRCVINQKEITDEQE